MDISSLLLAVAIGSFMGMIAGILPGISISKILLLNTVWIQYLPPVEIMALYVSLLVVAQYLDAIPAIFLGIPGETSAIPAAKESAGLRDRGLALDAVRLTALGRLLGSLLVLVVTVPLMGSLLQATWVFANRVQLLILMIAVIGIAATSDNPRWRTVLLMVAGFVLGAIGFNEFFDRDILTFGMLDLHNGLPLTAVVMGLYVTPMVVNFKGFSIIDIPNTSTSVSKSQLWQYKNTIAGSGLVGSILGLIPGISYVLSSTVAYNFVKNQRTKSGQYQSGDLHSVIASETATNTGAFSSLLPLVLFGIPITVSESVIWNFMVQNNAVFSHGDFFIKNWPTLTAVFLLVNVIGLLLAWPASRFILDVFVRIPVSWLKIFIVSVCVFTVVYIGYANGLMIMYLGCYIVMTAIGFAVKKWDILPMMFVFIIQPSLERALTTAYQLYF